MEGSTQRPDPGGSTRGRRTRVWIVVAVALLTVLAIVELAGGDGGRDASDGPSSTTRVERRASSELPPAASSTTAPLTTPPSTATPAPPVAAPGPTGVPVTEVVDGDTLVVADGQRVRMIGIDTPERGQCGYYEATAALSSLVAGRPVVLVPGARDDVDRYGRQLRYVEVGGTDLNLEMLRSGHARSRYDSRDGYGRHDREDAYVAADLSAPDRCPAAAPTTLAPTPVAPSGGADPRFGTCREAIAAGGGPYVRGIDVEYDWYRDADGDGVVCE